MSNRKLKQNDENLCPISSKRTKTSVDLEIQAENQVKGLISSNSSTWIAAKLESTSSPSGLSNEYLEEMGVGLLDSEESSSSASSAMNFVGAFRPVPNKADQNCNEATPNFDAPKFPHHQQVSLTQVYTDQANNSPFDIKNILGDQSDTMMTAGSSNNNNDNISLNSFEIFTDESCQQIPERKNWPNNGSLNGSGHKRSPLATVVCNRQSQSSQQIQVQNTSPEQYIANAFSNAANNTPSNVVLLDAAIISQPTTSRIESSLSPQQPSTSRQAAALINKKNEQQKAALKSSSNTNNGAYGTKIDDFFIFRNQQLRERASNGIKGIDHFNLLSDEIVLQIFKWLPKKALLRCGLVCRRFYQCAADESLWSRLDLGGRSLRPEVMHTVLARGVIVCRLAQTNFREPVFPLPPTLMPLFQSKLQYLDLSLSQIDKSALRSLLSYCRQLKKLSLEHVPLNNDICNEIAENTNLEALNLAMCTGLEAWSIRKMFKPLKNLISLNISWTNLSVDTVTSLVTHLTPNLMRLNVAGCRKTMFDTHVASLVQRCPQLIELDLSDCTGLTGCVITILSNFKMLEYLSLSRCYLINAMAYFDLKNLPTLAFLDVFGTLTDEAVHTLERSLPGLSINKFVHSCVARPTVGTRRTSIWGLRTRD